MKRKLVSMIMTAIMAAGILAGCGSASAPASTQEPAAAPAEEEAAPAEETAQESSSAEEAAAEELTASSFKPSGNITFNISSKAGGNSDLIIRTMTDIATKHGFVDQPFVIVNNTDGGGNIIRITTHDTNDPDHTLLCMSSGDMQSMLSSDIGLKIEDFAPIAIMAADKQLIFAKAGGKYTEFENLMADIDAGTKINVGGTKSNEKTVFDMFATEIDKVDSFNYMYYDSSAESITALLGDHIDLAMGSPAAAIEYVKSGDIVPVVALSDSRFEAPLDVAPTMEELGYSVVQSPMWRGCVAPGTMSEEAQQYWNDIFKAVSETDEWKEYLSTYLLSAYFQDLESSREIMKQTQEDYFASLEAEN